MASHLPLAVALAALVTGSTLHAQPQQPSEATLVLEGPAASLEGPVVWRQPPEREPEMMSAHAARGGQDTMRVTLACVPGEYFVQTARRVSTPFRLEASDCGSERKIATYSSAGVRGRVVLPTEPAPADVAEQPSSPAQEPVVIIRMRSCADRGRGAALGEYRVRATEEGHFAAVVPSGCLALGLRVAALAPVQHRPLMLHRGDVGDG
jgi:hypothetical protein